MTLSNRLKQLNAPFSASIELEGQEYLYFAGTAYLGIPQHEGFLKHYLEGIKHFGLNNGTSRHNNIQLGIYEAAEQYAADLFGAEATLISSSGYLAAQLTVKHCSSFGQVSYAPQTHPALWSGDEPQQKGSCFTAWSEEIVREINNSEQKNWVLFSNSLNNLFPERYDFSFIEQIDKDKQLWLIVDDSHGIGILDGGRGIFNLIPEQRHVEVLVVASMAKALGLDAGIVMGSAKAISALKESNEFAGASPPSAAGLYAFMQAKGIYKEELLRLLELDNWLSSNINRNWQHIEGFPVFYNPDQQAFEKLLRQQVIISSFPYPDQHGKPVNRIVLSSWHRKSDLNHLLSVL